MNFTYSSYANLVLLLTENNYTNANYYNCDDFERVAILRHDVDTDLTKALEFAEFENSLGVSSTYFILLSSNFYNVFSQKSLDIIHKIKGLGHAIGLHFDETKYIINNKDDFEINAKSELNLFSQIVNGGNDYLSMHRPSKLALEGNFDFGDTVNSYSKKFFNEYKYLSDSRMNWREDVISIVQSGDYNKLQILTHPIWYQKVEIPMKDILLQFLSRKNDEIYYELEKNIRALEEVIPEQPRDFRLTQADRGIFKI